MRTGSRKGALVDAGRPSGSWVEFLTRAQVSVPEDLSVADLDLLRCQEAQRARELEDEGRLVRAWRPHAATTWSNICLWRAEDEPDLWKHLRTLPLFAYMSITVDRLDGHPSDPAGYR
jgi:muconolactone delta-isomerase